MIRQSQSFVEFVGEVGGPDKDAFLGNAYALLFPITWPEPFGLVMIEAMACGTPIIAYRRGSVPEVMEQGVTGFVVERLDEAVQAVARVATLSRKRCRQVFEQRFTAARMTKDYLRIYRRLLEERAPKTQRLSAKGFSARPIKKGQRARLDPDCLGVWPARGYWNRS